MIGVVLSIPLGLVMIVLAARRGLVVPPMWARDRGAPAIA
jgi:hypothetical protein